MSPAARINVPHGGAEVLFGHLLGRRLPGPGTAIVAPNQEFRGRLSVGDALTATITAKEKQTEVKLAVFDRRCVNQRDGRAQKVTRSRLGGPRN